MICWLFDLNHKVKPSTFVVVCCLKKLHSSHKSGTQSMTGFKMSILSVHHRFYALCPLVLFPLFTWLVLLILTIWLMMPDESSLVLFPFHTVLENHGWNWLQHAYFGIKLVHHCNQMDFVIIVTSWSLCSNRLSILVKYTNLFILM